MSQGRSGSRQPQLTPDSWRNARPPSSQRSNRSNRSNRSPSHRASPSQHAMGTGQSRPRTESPGAAPVSGDESDNLAAIHLAPRGATQTRGGSQPFGTQRISAQRRLVTQAAEGDEEEEEEEADVILEVHTGADKGEGEDMDKDKDKGKETEEEQVKITHDAGDDERDTGDDKRDAGDDKRDVGDDKRDEVDDEHNADGVEHSGGEDTNAAAPMPSSPAREPTLKEQTPPPQPSLRRTTRATAGKRATPTPTPSQTTRRSRGTSKLPPLPPSRVYVEIPPYPFKFRTTTKPPPLETQLESSPAPAPAAPPQPAPGEAGPSSYMDRVELPDADSDVVATPFQPVPKQLSYMDRVELPDADSDIEFVGASRPITPAPVAASAAAPRPSVPFIPSAVIEMRRSAESPAGALGVRSSHPLAGSDSRTSQPPASMGEAASRQSSTQAKRKRDEKVYEVDSSGDSDEQRESDRKRRSVPTASSARRRDESSDDARGSSSRKKHKSSKSYKSSNNRKKRISDDRHRRKKGHSRRRDDSDSDSDSDRDDSHRRQGKKGKKSRRSRRDDTESDSDSGWDQGRRRRRRADPDNERNAGAETEDEDVAEIKLDEPDRFKTDTRLRAPKQSKFLAGLKKLNSKRVAQRWPPPSSGEDEEESESEDEGSDDDDDGSSEDSRDFIVSDDDVSGVALPEEFSLKRESPEYKFKVVFQYLVLLVIKGPSVLPLRGEDEKYFGRQLRDVRKQMRGFRDSIAGSLWRPEFRKALETYPIWKQQKLDEIEPYCDGCNRRNQKCTLTAWLRGSPYNKETHQDKDEEDGSESSGSSNSDDSNDSDDDPRDLGDFTKGCLNRAKDFHLLTHWEHNLYLWVRRRYHCMLRAKKQLALSGIGPRHYRDPSFDSLASNSSDSEGEISAKARARLNSRKLVDQILESNNSNNRIPNDMYDVNQVTEWMDAFGWQKDAMQHLRGIEGRARNLEKHY